MLYIPVTSLSKMYTSLELLLVHQRQAAQVQAEMNRVWWWWRAELEKELTMKKRLDSEFVNINDHNLRFRYQDV